MELSGKQKKKAAGARLGAAGRSPSSAAVTREARAAVGGKHRDGWGELGPAPDSRYQAYITQLHSRHGGTAAPEH